MVEVGLISDTHRLLRDEAVACLKGSGLTIHAGDIGSMDVISGLRSREQLTFSPRGSFAGHQDSPTLPNGRQNGAEEKLNCGGTG